MLMTKNKLPTIMHASKAPRSCPVCKGVHSNHRLYFHIFCKPASIYSWTKRGMAHETETRSNCQLRQCWYEYKLGVCQCFSRLYCFWATHFGVPLSCNNKVRGTSRRCLKPDLKPSATQLTVHHPPARTFRLLCSLLCIVVLVGFFFYLLTSPFFFVFSLVI